MPTNLGLNCEQSHKEAVNHKINLRINSDTLVSTEWDKTRQTVS